MQQRPRNFDKQIHNEEYKAHLYEPRLTHEGMFHDAYREKELLNGLWHFQVDQYDTFLRSEWYKEELTDKEGRAIPPEYNYDQWDVVSVPSCWNIKDQRCFYYEGIGIYTRKFKYVNRGEERVFIKIGAANYETRIFLNKQFIGYHKGGSTPFYVEVTDYLEKENRIQVVVDNSRRKDTLPADNTDWFNYGGLYRDVALFRLPKTFIKDFKLQLQPGSNMKILQGHIRVDGPEQEGEALLRIPELNIKQTVYVKNGKASIEIEAHPELWSTDTPKLYKVEITYGEDVVKESIGFREIMVKGTDIYLNGEKIFLKGIACHEESKENGKAVTEEEIVENLRIAKEMNCNYMRVAHYPHSERVAQIADTLGIMLWEEIPVYWTIEFENPETIADAQNQLLELIKRDQNRASVIIWSVGNENPDTDARLQFMKNLALKAKETDATRLISAACLVDKISNIIDDRLSEYLDIIGINEYYGWYDPNFEKLPQCFENSKPDKPVVITEFGAGALSGHRGTRDDFFTEDHQYNVYKRQVEVLGSIPYIKGISPWILFDFRCPRRTNQYQKGYNLKGLLSGDKKHKKLAYYVMQEFYRDK